MNPLYANYRADERLIQEEIGQTRALEIQCFESVSGEEARPLEGREKAGQKRNIAAARPVRIERLTTEAAES
jgi:hypothetical protein